MTNAYRAVQWNPHKRTYDALVLAAAAAMLGGFVGASMLLAAPEDELSPEILAIRALLLPGAALLWPLLLPRALRGGGAS